MNKCRHCRRNIASRPRKLCWSCYYKPGVRDLYPVRSRYGRRGVPDFFGPSTEGEPIRAIPGSAEKIAALRQRAELREELFHPEDAER